MAKPEWGAKRLCASCGERFYDLQRDPITCPDCGAPFEIEVLTRGKRVRATVRAETAAKVVVDDIDVVDDEDIEDEAEAVVLDEVDDDADDVPTPAVADDDDLDTDDDVLLEDDEDEADDDLGDLVEDKGDDDLRS